MAKNSGMMTQDEEQHEKELIYSFYVVQIQYSKYRSSYCVWFLKGLKVPTTDLQELKGAVVQKLYRVKQTHQPLLRGSDGSQFHVKATFVSTKCFQGKISPQPQELFRFWLQTPAKMRQGGKKKNSNQEQSPLIDFLATLWHLTVVMGNTGNDSLSSPADK